MPPALDITDLRYRYRASDEWILRIDRLSLDAGERVLVTGESGRGKSTLLHLIAGVLDIPRDAALGSGTIRVAGADLHALRGAARDRFRGQHLGMVFQTFNLLHGFTAVENVMTALLFSNIPSREHESRALALLERLGVERPGALPDELSVGQQQRVAVARALACEPAIVLADEPTASLDPARASEAMDLLVSACAERNAALVCVSHDPAMAERFERRECLNALADASAARTGGEDA